MPEVHVRNQIKSESVNKQKEMVYIIIAHFLLFYKRKGRIQMVMEQFPSYQTIEESHLLSVKQ
ncbi:MAG TPA: hypothetical protein DDZ99_00515 [Clostridiales bacterium]|nr:hypothetical protein [Clostridiales bacterium]